MRMLVISDLHANWPALEAVLAAEPHDHLLVVGDLVSYGPHAPEVVEHVRQHATLAVRGNHDEALAHQVDCRCAPASKPLAEATRARHREELTPDQVEFLGGLPATASLTTGGLTLFAVHASPRDHFYRYTLTPGAPDAHLAEETSEVEADCVLLGHTHLPLARRVGPRMVVNPGSVGQPRDGDPRASYAVIEDGGVLTAGRGDEGGELLQEFDGREEEVRGVGRHTVLSSRARTVGAQAQPVRRLCRRRPKVPGEREKCDEVAARGYVGFTFR